MGKIYKLNGINGIVQSKQLSLENMKALEMNSIKNHIRENIQSIVNKNSNYVVPSNNRPAVFSSKGTVTLNSILARREIWLNKSAKKIQKMMRRYGYESQIRPSINSPSGSKAKIIVVTNKSKERNIDQVLVSPGSKRHGNIPYVKISTNNIGKIKIISDYERYKTDGHEKATILYRRRFKKK